MREKVPTGILGLHKGRGSVNPKAGFDCDAGSDPITQSKRAAPAHDPRRNFAECVKEMGLMRDRSYTVNLQSGGRLRRWRLNSEAQTMTLNDCVTRKART